MMISEKPESSETQEILYCKCGGQYVHVAAEEKGNGIFDVIYQCDRCEEWCIVTWDKEADEETGRRYERW